MSTKTLRKRVALIAVSAMGFGLLTGVSTPANAAAGTGAGDISAVTSAGKSVGLLANDFLDSTAGTATLLSTGTLVVKVESGTVAGYGAKLVVSAGAYIDKLGTAGNGTIAGDQKSVTATDSVTALAEVWIKPTGAVGSTFTITTYQSSASGTAVNNIVTVTIAGASVSNTVSVAESTVTWVSNDGDASTTDVASASETTTGKALSFNIQLNDAYKQDLTTAGALVVTVSSGAKVTLGSSAGSSAGTTGAYTTAVASTVAGDWNGTIVEATSGSGWSGTVTVTFNGTVIATKSGKITGDVAKLTVTPLKVGKNNGSSTAKAFSYKAADAAGNDLSLASANVVYNKSSDEAKVAAAAGSVDPTTTSDGYGTITCATSAIGSADISVKTVLSSGVTVVSNTFKVNCGGIATSYSAAWDKAKYSQGEIATLTITFKDAKGSLANSVDSVTALVSTAVNATIAAPMMEKIAAATPSYDDLVGVDGTIKYKYTVGGGTGTFAAGKYNAIVTYPTPALGSAQTVAYEVTAPAGGVSNSDILASIVKLITAINKQIAALQKLLLKR